MKNIEKKIYNESCQKQTTYKNFKLELSKYYMQYSVIMSHPRLSQKTKQKAKDEMIAYQKHLKEQNKKNRQKNTIIRNIKEKDLIHYITITLKPNKRIKESKLVQQSLLKMLYRYKIPYILIPEYQKDGTIHFHGFVRFKNEMLNVKVINDRIVRDKFYNVVLEWSALEENYGFSQVIDVSSKSNAEKDRIVRYMTKYMLKDDVKLLSSRFKVNTLAYDLAIEYFGVDKVKMI